jgi:hypothetical protein
LLNRVLGKYAVAVFQRLKRLTDDLLGEAPHFGNLVVKRGEVLFISTDDMLV